MQPSVSLHGPRRPDAPLPKMPETVTSTTVARDGELEGNASFIAEAIMAPVLEPTVGLLPQKSMEMWQSPPAYSRDFEPPELTSQEQEFPTAWAPLVPVVFLAAPGKPVLIIGLVVAAVALALFLLWQLPVGSSHSRSPPRYISHPPWHSSAAEFDKARTPPAREKVPTPGSHQKASTPGPYRPLALAQHAQPAPPAPPSKGAPGSAWDSRAPEAQRSRVPPPTPNINPRSMTASFVGESPAQSFNEVRLPDDGSHPIPEQPSQAIAAFREAFDEVRGRRNVGEALLASHDAAQARSLPPTGSPSAEGFPKQHR